MASKQIRFGVRSSQGFSSESWRCWTAANTAKGDVYVMCRRIGQIKLSLHESGRWHVGWVGKPDELFDENEIPSSPHFIVSRRPVGNQSPRVLACRIFVPSGAVTIPSDEEETEIIWVAPPAHNNVIEFQIYLAAYPHYCISWPGKAEGTKLLGHMPLPNNETVYIVYRERSAIPVPSSQNIVPRLMKGMSQDDMLKGNRAILIGDNPDGSLSFCETPVAITNPT